MYRGFAIEACRVSNHDEMTNREQGDLRGTVALLCVLRNQGTLSEDQIAVRLGFEADSATDSPARGMYIRLKNTGLPDWLVYPGASPQADEQRHAAGDEGTGRAADEPRRKARAAGGGNSTPRRREGRGPVA